MKADNGARSAALSGADVAAWAASRGWTVIPAKPGEKRPYGKWGHVRYRDPATVRRQWPKGEWAVCVATGPSGLVCDDLDVDDEGNPVGEWSLELLAQSAGEELPRTFTLATPSGGTHLVWQSTNGREYKTCAGQVAPHFDVRGRGGQFVLWDPTIPGRIVTDDREPAGIPAWLAELHPEPGAGVEVIADVPDARAWLGKYGDGDDGACDAMAATLEESLDGFGDQNAHDEMAEAVYKLVGDRVAGHAGLNHALQQIQVAFYREMSGKTREREKVADWWNAIATGIGKKMGARKRPGRNDPCLVEDEDDGGIKPANRPSAGSKLIQWASERTPQLVSWLWTGYFVLGAITMLDGESEIGKTLTLYDVAARASRGDAMPDGSRAVRDPVNVLVLAPEEMIDSVIVPRLMAARADMSRIALPRDIETRRGRAPDMLLLPQSAPKITAMIRESRASFLIIDPITAFFDPKVNSNNDPSVRSALSPLSAQLGSTNCSVAMVRHLSKNQAVDAKHRGGGSVAFGAVARVHLVAGKLPASARSSGVFGISQVGSNMTKAIAGTLTYSIEDSGIQMDDQGNMVPLLEWHEKSDIDANTLLGGDGKPRGPEPEAQNEIIDVLNELFEIKDTWDATEATKELKNAGVSLDSKTVDKAKAKLGIVSKPVHNPSGGVSKWVWTNNPGKLRARRSGGKE